LLKHILEGTCMADSPQGLYDKRTRVTLFLPINNEQHENAIFEIIAYFQSKLDSPIPITGFTRSLTRPASFYGYWWDENSSKWVEEYNISFVIDFGLHFSARELPRILKELKQTIADWYEHCGSKQDEIWLIAQPVERYA